MCSIASSILLSNRLKVVGIRLLAFLVTSSSLNVILTVVSLFQTITIL